MRALTVEELGFVSGGFGLSGPGEDRPPDIVIVRARRRTPDYWYENGLVQDFFQNQANYRDMVCNHMRGQVEIWASEEREGVIVAGAGVAAVAVGAAAGSTGVAAPVGAVLIAGGGMTVVAGTFVALRANHYGEEVLTRRQQLNCP